MKTWILWWYSTRSQLWRLKGTPSQMTNGCINLQNMLKTGIVSMLGLSTLSVARKWRLFHQVYGFMESAMFTRPVTSQPHFAEAADRAWGRAHALASLCFASWCCCIHRDQLSLIWPLNYSFISPNSQQFRTLEYYQKQKRLSVVSLSWPSDSVNLSDK